LGRPPSHGVTVRRGYDSYAALTARPSPV
jgi:hypothetical protein